MRMRTLILAASICGAIILSGGRTVAQSTVETSSSRHKALVEVRFKAWAEGTGGPFDLLADDATWTIVGRSAAAGTYKGREAFLRDVIRPFNARMREPLKPTVQRIYTDGDTVIVRFDARGVARDGQPYVNTYAWFLEMHDGRVTSAVAFFDSLAFDDFWRRVQPR